MPTGPQEGERKKEEKVHDQDDVTLLADIQGGACLPHRGEESLQPPLGWQVPILVVAKPDEPVEPLIELPLKVLQPLRTLNVKKRRGWSKLAMDVFEDLAIGIAENVNA